MIPTIIEIPTCDTRIRCFRSHLEIDCFAVVTQRYVVVVDTFATPQEAMQMMNMLTVDLTGRQLLVVNTHQHYDHVWGNSIFASGAAYPAPIFAHEKSLSLDVWSLWEANLPKIKTQTPRFAGVCVTHPTIVFKDTLKIDGGDLTLQLLPAPGHSPDQVVVWISEIEVLLAADALEFPFPYLDIAADLPVLLKTMQTLQALEPQHVLLCHEGMHSSKIITQNISYFERLKQKCTNYKIVIDNEEEEILERVYPFEEALLDLHITELDQKEVYQGFHKRNIRAAIEYTN